VKEKGSMLVGSTQDLPELEPLQGMPRDIRDFYLILVFVTVRPRTTLIFSFCLCAYLWK
jgi:hypothetical protein